jgi:phage shock protein A
MEPIDIEYLKHLDKHIEVCRAGLANARRQLAQATELRAQAERDAVAAEAVVNAFRHYRNIIFDEFSNKGGTITDALK